MKSKKPDPDDDPLTDETPVSSFGFPPEERRCTAQSKQQKRRCRNWNEPPMRVCRFHGARSPGGKVTTGAWSQSLGKLARGMEHALNDASLLDMRPSVALLRVLTTEIAQRLEDGDTTDLRQRALTLHNEALRAQTDGDILLMAERLNELGDLLREGVAEDRTIRDLSENVERLSRVTKAAWDVKLSKKTAINARDLVAVFARFVDIVRTVTDAQTAKRVADRIDFELLGEG